ncbi:MAG: acyltransferase [Candidatus Ancillula sp.]|jgi:hypothetical protein|nr:acyltransferase [Candidatus Ancillula sp.]
MWTVSEPKRKGERILIKQLIKQRSSNFELLRIIFIVLILFCHNVDFLVMPDWARWIGYFGKASNHGFFLLSGYFLVNSKIDVKSVIKREVKVLVPGLFYAILFIPISLFIYSQIAPWRTARMDYIKFVLTSPTGLFEYLIRGGGFFFLETYILVILISPILIFITRKLFEKLGKWSLILGFFVILFFYICEPAWENRLTPLFRLIGFGLTFAFGCLMRKAVSEEKWSVKSKTISILALCFIVIYIAFTTHPSEILHIQLPFFFQADPNTIPMGSIWAFLFAVIIVYVFKNIHIKYNKVINKVATTVFPVYLIHTNFLIGGTTFWFMDILHSGEIGIHFWPYVPLATFGLGVVFVFVDLILQKVYKPLMNKIANLNILN